jgi:membrane protease subunit HflK
MPWSNQTGGGKGPGNDGGNQGPWGSGPKNSGRGGGEPPDIEDLLKRGQDRLRQSIPGGGNSRLLAPLIVVAAAVFWLYQGFYQVQPDELAIELLFGKPKEEVSTQGLHFHLWPVESFEKVRIVENQINIGVSTRTNSADSGLMLSGDQNIVDVTFSVLWQVGSPADFLFNVRDPEEMVRQVAESAMREIVGRRPAEDIFRRDRQSVALAVQEKVQETLDGYGAGIIISALNIEDVAPPPEVADAFDEVQRAEQDEDRLQEEANKYSNNILGQARGEAAKMREAAAAYKNRIVKEAEGEAQRFISVYNEYDKARDVTRTRLFLETMEQVLSKSTKVILGSDAGSGVVPYLPLPEINKRSGE